LGELETALDNMRRVGVVLDESVEYEGSLQTAESSLEQGNFGFVHVSFDCSEQAKIIEELTPAGYEGAANYCGKVVNRIREIGERQKGLQGKYDAAVGSLEAEADGCLKNVLQDHSEISSVLEEVRDLHRKADQASRLTIEGLIKPGASVQGKLDELGEFQEVLNRAKRKYRDLQSSGDVDEHVRTFNERMQTAVSEWKEYKGVNDPTNRGNVVQAKQAYDAINAMSGSASQGEVKIDPRVDQIFEGLSVQTVSPDDVLDKTYVERFHQYCGEMRGSAYKSELGE
jgi:hypothetical protein